MADNLLPCPFCGGKPEFRRSGQRGHYIACTGCDTASTMFTAAKDDVRDLLIETWNRRPSPEPQPPIGDQTWCQPGDIRARQFLVTFDDPECRNAVFDDETEARRFWAKACLNWNCYLFGALPVDAARQTRAMGPSPVDNSAVETVESGEN